MFSGGLATAKGEEKGWGISHKSLVIIYKGEDNKS